MKAKVLTAISVVAVPILMFNVLSARDDENGIADETSETFVERAVRTRLNTDVDRSSVDLSDETFLERAVRTRASELVDRVNSAQ